MLSSSKYNLCENSLNTVDWFKTIKNISTKTFIQFDIIEFYPFITRELLLKSLNQAKEYTNITEKEIEIILTCKKSILTDNRRGGARGVMVIVVGNRHGDMSSNPGWDWLHFT